MPNYQGVPPGVDVNTPNVARVYDYTLGGKDNFAVDRELADMAARVAPDASAAALANRGFLRRVVRYLVAEAGIRQFLDIGSGLPTQGNVHEIAHEVDPLARVVYVDNDPIVIAHARALLDVTDNTKVVAADLRRPGRILGDTVVEEFLDLGQPVGLLLLAILHHLTDDEDPAGLVAQLRDALPPGSYLAVSHFHNPGSAHPDDAELATAMETLFEEKLGTGRFRTREEISGYFGDFDLLEPGLVALPEWRPGAAGDGPLAGETYRFANGFVGGVARAR